MDRIVRIKCQFGYVRRSGSENELQVCFAIERYGAVTSGTGYGREENMLEAE